MKGRAKRTGMRERSRWTDTDKEGPKAGGFHEALGTEMNISVHNNLQTAPKHTSNNKADTAVY